jgi:intergrase/recombinase
LWFEGNVVPLRYNKIIKDMKKTNLQRVIEILNKNGVDTYTPEKLVYNDIVIYNIEVGDNSLAYEGCAEDYLPLTDEVVIAELLNEIMIEFNEVSIWDLTEEQVVELVKKITWNSIYHADYCNRFGVDCKVVCVFAEGFLEDKEYELGSWDEVVNYIKTAKKEVIGNEFYHYIQSVESW